MNEYLSNSEKEGYFSWLRKKKNGEQSDTEEESQAKKKYDRNKSNISSDALSEQEFNQIYEKIFNNIQKSLGQDHNSQKVFSSERINCTKSRGGARICSNEDQPSQVLGGLEPKNRSKMKKKTFALIDQNFRMSSARKKYDARV